MMKMWSRLCFLVLAISSISRGQNDTAVSNKEVTPKPLTAAPPTFSDEAPSTPSSPQSQPSVTDLPSTNSTTHEETQIRDKGAANTTEGDDGSSAPQTTASGAVPGIGGDGVDVDVMTVSMTTAATSSWPVIIEEGHHSFWGYVILIFIILMIIALCFILYFLRKISRMYSFDLQRPVHNHNEPTGTFEPVYLDDLDRPAPKDQVTTEDLSPPPVANGTTLQSEEKGSNEENAPQDQSDANGLGSSPTSNTSLSLDDDPADKTSSPLRSTVVFFDAIEKEQQNENNNNPSVCSSDPFVEINLDEPAWCDQLLTSPEAPSSVLPFSPFSFSSSSSSSSS